ncbi:hypothetical protein SRHO_G00098640 [Serrasalmus rhombeus]
MKLFKLKADSTPSAEFLSEVITCLTKVQAFLLSLQKMWENIQGALASLNNKTFAMEGLLMELSDEDFKNMILAIVTEAQQDWKRFESVCTNVQKQLCTQNKQAYIFLEVSPSSLTKEAWDRRYDDVKKKLSQTEPALPPLTPNTD